MADLLILGEELVSLVVFWGGRGGIYSFTLKQYTF